MNTKSKTAPTFTEQDVADVVAVMVLSAKLLYTSKSVQKAYIDKLAKYAKQYVEES